MNKKSTPLALLLLGCMTLASAQVQPNEIKKNNLYLEMFGSSGLYSVHYDRILPTPSRWIQFTAGAGLSLYNNTALDLPVHASLLLGPRSGRLELGGGIQPEIYYYSEDASETQLMYFSRIGYSYQRRQGGLHFRFGVTPLYYPKVNWKSSWVALAFGWTF
jgi:hypothetical protein